MNALVSKVIILAIVAINLANAVEQQQNQQQQISLTQQQQQAAGPAALVVEQRQGRSLNGNGNSINSLNNGNSNMIEHSSMKSRSDEKRQVQEFFTAKNMVKSIIKLLFGNQEEISATSRQVLGILGKVLELLKTTFGQTKSRSGARTIKDSAEDAANAGVSMLQGYVKSVLANDNRCVQRYLCQASKEATKDSRDLGYIIASVGGYASSYLLDTKNSSFKSLYEASMKGRSSNEDCAKLYSDCNEVNY